MDCIHLENDRTAFLCKGFCENQNIIEFYELVNINNAEKLQELSNFLKEFSKMSALLEACTFSQFF